jgi:hypothetical protein
MNGYDDRNADEWGLVVTGHCGRVQLVLRETPLGAVECNCLAIM